MTSKRKIDVFTAGCPLCDETVALVQAAACPACEVTVHDTHQPTAAAAARAYGVTRMPAVVIDGKLADCCRSGRPDEAVLRAAGLGRA